MALIPTYSTPIPAFDVLNELNNIINQINTNFAQQNAPGAAIYAANTATSGATAAAASIGGPGVAQAVLDMTGTLGAGANLTLPTAALLAAQIPQLQVGTSWRLRIINDSSANFAWTVVAGAGDTLTGTATIAQNAWRDFLVTCTAVATPAFTFQGVGTGTNS